MRTDDYIMTVDLFTFFLSNRAMYRMHNGFTEASVL